MRKLVAAIGLSILLTMNSIASAQENVRGGADAPVTILVFSAFNCPYCAEASKQLDTLQKRYGDLVQVVFKHYPLGTDRAALLPHEAVIAASEQGKFWEMHDRLFASPSGLNADAVIRIAGELKLELGRFQQALSSGHLRKDIDRDLADAKALKVRATPTFFVDGMRLEGLQDIESFAQIIEFRSKGRRVEPAVAKPASVREILLRSEKN